MRNFVGKAAFVTGGASGIGLGITKALLSEGMRVAIGDVNQSHLAAARDELVGADVIFVDVDVTDRTSVAAAAAATTAAFGDLHVLCNNAGIAGGGRPSPIRTSLPGTESWGSTSTAPSTSSRRSCR